MAQSNAGGIVLAIGVGWFLLSQYKKSIAANTLSGKPVPSGYPGSPTEGNIAGGAQPYGIDPNFKPYGPSVVNAPVDNTGVGNTSGLGITGYD